MSTWSPQGVNEIMSYYVIALLALVIIGLIAAIFFYIRFILRSRGTKRIIAILPLAIIVLLIIINYTVWYGNASHSKTLLLDFVQSKAETASGDVSYVYSDNGIVIKSREDYEYLYELLGNMRPARRPFYIELWPVFRDEAYIGLDDYVDEGGELRPDWDYVLWFSRDYRYHGITFGDNLYSFKAEDEERLIEFLRRFVDITPEPIWPVQSSWK